MMNSQISEMTLMSKIEIVYAAAEALYYCYDDMSGNNMSDEFWENFREYWERYIREDKEFCQMVDDIGFKLSGAEDHFSNYETLLVKARLFQDEIEVDLDAKDN